MKGMSAAYSLNPHALPLFLCSALLAILGFSAVRAKHTPLNLYFSGLCLSGTIWLVGTAFGYLVRDDAHLAALWFRVDWIGVSFLSINAYAFSTALLKLQRRKSIIFGYIVALTFAILTTTSNPLMMGVRKYSWGFYPLRDILWNIPFFIFFFSYMGQAFIDYISAYRVTSDPVRKNQIKYMFAAFLTAYLGSIDYLPTFGIDVYPLGFLAITAFVAISAYAITRHRLMDIDLAVRDWIVLGLSASLTAVVVFISLSPWLSQSVPTLILSLVGMLLTGWLSPVIFPKVRAILQPLARGKSYRYLLGSERQAKEPWNLDSLEEALPIVARSVLASAPYRACSILVMFDEQPMRPCFRTTQVRLTKGEVIEGNSLSEEVIFAFLTFVRSKGRMVVRREEREMPVELSQLDPLLFEVAVPLLVNGKVVGVVVMGPKEGRNALLHHKDLEILQTLAQTLNDRLAPSVGLNLFRLIVNQTLHDAISHQLGPLLEMLLVNIPVPQEMLVKTLVKLKDHLMALRKIAHNELDQGKKKELGILDVEILLHEIYQTHRSAAEKKGLTFKLQISSPLPRPRFDAVLVERCVGNLITNAIKYTMNGHIELMARQDGECLVVAVADSGLGIPPESLDRIFQAGYRVPGKATIIAEGTGIGLANVKEIMVAIGGFIKITTELGKGSKFMLYFPLPPGVAEGSTIAA